MGSSFVDIQNLGKRYGKFQAVTDLTLQVDRGVLFALLGPNGAGKTTTIRMLMGILQPTAGSARIAGLDCFADRVEVMQRIGYLPDEPIFYDHLRGREIIRFAGVMHGLTLRQIEDRSAPLLQRLDLGNATEEYAVNYSRGMKKKLGLICALLHDPQLLILDEPASGLDPAGIRTLHELMREKAAEGKTVFFSTHHLEQAEKLCHEIGILHKGRLAMAGTLDEMRETLAHDSSLEGIYFLVTRGVPAEPAEAGRVKS
jgi:ABC-2 type transport system ATP-binding protein